MLGAIVGDIVGSRFERNNLKSKNFRLFSWPCRFTDDTVMSLAVANALMQSRSNPQMLGRYAVASMRMLGRLYRHAGYGGRFAEWLASDRPQPYNSFGNGAAMRVGACGALASSAEEAKAFAKTVTEVTHSHPEGIKGAEAVAVAVFMARNGASKEAIREVVVRDYYPLGFTLDGIRGPYTFDVTCQGSVPQALEAFFESVGFEDCIRNAVSIGGDSDTIAAIAGSVAEEFYGITPNLRERAMDHLDDTLLNLLMAFEEICPPKIAE